MGIEINLNNVKAFGNSEILSRAKFGGAENIKISLEDLDINEQAKLLNDLEINPVLDELRRCATNMDTNSREYTAIQDILKEEVWDKKTFIARLGKHIGDFSKGVLASIVANYFTQ